MKNYDSGDENGNNDYDFPGPALLVQRHSSTPTRRKLGPDSSQLSLQVIIIIMMIFTKSH